MYKILVALATTGWDRSAAFGRDLELKFKHDQDPQGPGSGPAVSHPVSRPLHTIVQGPAVRARGSGDLAGRECRMESVQGQPQGAGHPKSRQGIRRSPIR